MHDSSNAYHRKCKKAAVFNLDNNCESLCEDPLEILHEIVHYDANLQTWFDRELDFGHGSFIDARLGIHHA
jgi:hypothetical protein